MTRQAQAPEVFEGDFGRTLSHPAFGVAIVSRWHSSDTHRLFGSRLGHHSAVSLEICTAVSQDDRHGYTRETARQTVVRIDMSEAQWARLVTSEGLANGVPVTLMRYNTAKAIETPAIAEPETSVADRSGLEMAAELEARFAQFRTLIDHLGQMIETSAGKKAMRTLHHDLSIAAENLAPNVQYAFERFGEMTETVLDEAKTEIDIHAARRAAVREVAQFLEAPSLPRK